MSEFTNMAMDLTASLWLKPATWDELYERKVDSLKSANQYMFNSILKMAESKGWIYEKGEIFYCYKKTVKQVLNPAGYSIDF